MKFTSSELQNELVDSVGDNLSNIGLCRLDYGVTLKGYSNDYHLDDSMWVFSLALALGVQKQSFPSLAGIGSGRKGCSIFMKIGLEFIFRNSLVLKVKESLLLEEPVHIVSPGPGDIFRKLTQAAHHGPLREFHA